MKEFLKENWRRYLTITCMYILVGVLFSVGIRFIFKSDNSPKQPDIIVADTTRYLHRIQILQDSIIILQHEKIERDEQIALLRNANLTEKQRLWTINEYIRTGRFPADSAIRAKFPSHIR